MKGHFQDDTGIFIPEGYDSSLDYRVAHLEWITRHPHFRATDYNIPYLRVMALFYEERSSVTLHNLMAFKFYYIDKEFLKKQSTIEQTIDSLIALESDKQTSENWAFVTIGFNEQTITVPDMVAVSHNVSKFKHFSSCKYVLEKFRTNGIHHHTHFLVDLDCKYTPSKLAQDLFKVKGIKKICLSASFIDVKMLSNKKNKAQPRLVYEDYLDGIKTESKMECVYKDRFWRKQNSIDDAYNI